MDYNILIKIFFIIALGSGIIAGIGLILFWRLIKKSQQKRIEEIEYQLNRILKLIAISAALSGISGGLGGILRFFI